MRTRGTLGWYCWAESRVLDANKERAGLFRGCHGDRFGCDNTRRPWRAQFPLLRNRRTRGPAPDANEPAVIDLSARPLISGRLGDISSATRLSTSAGFKRGTERKKKRPIGGIVKNLYFYRLKRADEYQHATHFDGAVCCQLPPSKLDGRLFFGGTRAAADGAETSIPVRPVQASFIRWQKLRPLSRTLRQKIDFILKVYCISLQSIDYIWQLI